MIQRIQSVYLLLAVIAVSLLFFMPIADLLTNANQVFMFRYRGLYEIKDAKEILYMTSYPLAILLTLNVIISLITIFKYKNRPLQMRLCILNIIFLLVSVILGYIFIYITFAKLNPMVHFKISAVMPLVAAVFTFMAYKGIQKDDKLVKSVDRIR
ncbi:MAG: DUF4293 domain-containing protein [Bacteroidales bacterium]